MCMAARLAEGAADCQLGKSKKWHRHVRAAPASNQAAAHCRPRLLQAVKPQAVVPQVFPVKHCGS